MLGIFQKKNANKARKYGIYRHLPTYEKIIRNLVSFSINKNIMGGGRITDLQQSLKLFDPLFIILGSGKEGFSYEIGHIYWICMYGFLSYLIFMRIAFIKYRYQTWSEYMWIIPFFIAFTVNIAIGEFKWMSIFLMLLAFSRVKSLKSKEIRKE